jgi:hypothetical protein
MTPFEIEAQHPDEFVLHLLGLAPGVVVEDAGRHWESLKKPAKTVEEYLPALKTQRLTHTVSVLRAGHPLLKAGNKNDRVPASGHPPIQRNRSHPRKAAYRRAPRVPHAKSNSSGLQRKNRSELAIIYLIGIRDRCTGSSRIWSVRCSFGSGSSV